MARQHRQVIVRESHRYTMLITTLARCAYRYWQRTPGRFGSLRAGARAGGRAVAAGLSRGRMPGGHETEAES